MHKVVAGLFLFLSSVILVAAPFLLDISVDAYFWLLITLTVINVAIIFNLEGY